jgi:hypothetical protein
MSGYKQPQNSMPYCMARFVSNGTNNIGGAYGIGTAAGFPYTNNAVINGPGGSFNNSTETYTVGKTGLYNLILGINIVNNSSPGNNAGRLGFNINNGSKYYGCIDNLEYWSRNGVEQQLTFSIIAPLNDGDTVKVFKESRDIQYTVSNDGNYFEIYFIA